MVKQRLIVLMKPHKLILVILKNWKVSGKFVKSIGKTGIFIVMAKY